MGRIAFLVGSLLGFLILHCIDCYEVYTSDPINNADATESIGLRHDVECWRAQGHPVCI
jgi:hypothetical protein